jgi:hypothetical protein
MLVTRNPGDGVMVILMKVVLDPATRFALQLPEYDASKPRAFVFFFPSMLLLFSFLLGLVLFFSLVLHL